jgi:hypothetical protein
MNTREKVLKEALNCVNGEREKQYGSPEDNFRRIADLWSTYLTSLFEDEEIVIDIDPIDVAKMMILFKIARSNGDKDKLDNYVDILGYGACAAEIFENGNKERNDIPQKRIEVFPCDHIKVAEECRNCDYAEKCMGTGVCLKEEEKKCIKNGESILDNFADHVNARVQKQTDNKYDSFLQEYNNISACIVRESSKADVHPLDVADRLTKNGNSPTEMVALLMAGKVSFDDIASYVEDTINKMKLEGLCK